MEKSLEVKELKKIESRFNNHYYNQFNRATWYDWFSNDETLGGKFKKYVLPVARILPKQFDDYIVWAKESVPMWCNGFVYNIFICIDDDTPSKIKVAKSETGYDLYIYGDGEEYNTILFKKNEIKYLKEVKKLINEFFNVEE